MNTSPKYASAKVLSKVLKEISYSKEKKTALFINPMKIGKSLIEPAGEFLKK